jgi:hypothetical protein
LKYSTTAQIADWTGLRIKIQTPVKKKIGEKNNLTKNSNLSDKKYYMVYGRYGIYLKPL